MLDESDLTGLTTEALVERAQHGEDAAYRQLHHRFNDRLLRGLRLSVPPDLADDAAQEAWVRAYERLSDLDQPSSFFSWLAAIARNSARSVLRDPARRDVQLGDTESVSVDRQADPYEAAEIREQEEAARSALDKLPSRQRRALQLRWIDGWSYREIAAMTGQSLSAIETLLYRARSNFHRQYESSLSGVEASDDVACYKVRSHIRRLGEGQLSQRRRMRVLNHLDRCDRCRTVHDKLGETWKPQGWLPFLPIPALLRNVWSSLATRGSAGSQLGTFTPAQFVGGAAVAVGIGVAVTSIGHPVVQTDGDDSAPAEVASSSIAAEPVAQGAISDLSSPPSDDTPRSALAVEAGDAVESQPAQSINVSSSQSLPEGVNATRDEPATTPSSEVPTGNVANIATGLVAGTLGLVSELASPVVGNGFVQGTLETLDSVVSTTGDTVSSTLGGLVP